MGILFTAVGGAIIFGFKKLIDQAAALNPVIQSQVDELMGRFQPAWNAFITDIATFALPVFEKFVDIILSLIDRFQNLDAGTRSIIVQFALWAGAGLLLMGVFNLITGTLATFVGTFIKVFGKIVPIIVGATQSIVAFLVAWGPILAIIGLVILLGLILGNLAVNWERNSKIIQLKVLEIKLAFSEWFNDLIVDAQDTAAKFANIFLRMAESLRQLLPSKLRDMLGLTNPIRQFQIQGMEGKVERFNRLIAPDAVRASQLRDEISRLNPVTFEQSTSALFAGIQSSLFGKGDINVNIETQTIDDRNLPKLAQDIGKFVQDELNRRGAVR